MSKLTAVLIYANHQKMRNNIEYTLLMILVTVTIISGFTSSWNSEEQVGSGCKCTKANYECGCCADIDIPKIGLDDSVCANIMYLPKDYGISLILKIDDHVILNETVSARNPPPICVDVPDLKKLASVCLDLYNLDISGGKFSGCMDLQARLAYVFVEKVHLGCFSVGKIASLDTQHGGNKSLLQKSVDEIGKIGRARAKKLNQLK